MILIGLARLKPEVAWLEAKCRDIYMYVYIYIIYIYIYIFIDIWNNTWYWQTKSLKNDWKYW